MNSNFGDLFDLEQIMTDTGGLISVNSKVAIRNKDQLSYVYSPGVGACCLEIQKDLSKADTLTNRTNSALVLTDSTGFKGYDAETWVQEQSIPFIEAKCAYYKIAANVDAYPILLDHKLTDSAETLYETLLQLSWSYNAIVLLRVSEDRMLELRSILKERPLRSLIITDDDYTTTKEFLEKNWMLNKVSVEQVISCLIRVRLDNMDTGFTDLTQLLAALDSFRKLNDPNNHDMIADNILVSELASIYYDSEKNIRDSVDFVKNFRLYNTEKLSPDEHDYTRSTINENSIYLHERFRGMMEIKSNINITNLRDLDKILCPKQIERISAKIAEDPELADYLTIRRNYSAIITNGTAILGFGDIGGLAGMPVMEGKCVLFGEFGKVNMMPICTEEKDTAKFIAFVQRIAPIFTSINLEDIKAP